MEFPKEVFIYQPTVDSLALSPELVEEMKEGVMIGVYRLVRSGPLVRKVEIGQPPRKTRKDKGVPRKAVEQKE